MKATRNRNSKEPLQFYFEELRKHDVISYERVLALGKIIEHGYKKIVSSQETEEQIRTAKHEIAEGNLRLVINIAMKFQERGVDLPDLIAEGNIGLMRAVDGYDYRLGYRFSTYAAWWIRQSIQMAIANTRATIRLPVNQQKLIRNLTTAERTLVQELGREPSSQELGEKIGSLKGKVKKTLEEVFECCFEE